jgi:hypothetical protein
VFGRATGRAKARQVDRDLARYVRRKVYAYSSYYRGALDQAGLGAAGVGGRADLARLEPTDLRTLPDPGTLVLRPDRASVRRHGSRLLVARAALARLLGYEPRFNRRVIEPTFKPVHWLLCGGVPIGCTLTDVARLGELGARALAMAGVTDRDVLVSVLPSGPSVAHWQLVQGARRARVAAVHLTPDIGAEQLVRLAPSVVVGEPEDLLRILSRIRAGGLSLVNLVIVLSVAEGRMPDARQRAAIAALAAPAHVISCWAPPGVRALWSECLEAAASAGHSASEVPALHTWPRTEVLETLNSGELLWTGVEWNGSVLLRVRTGAQATLEEGPCPYCGLDGVRVRPFEHGQVG